MKKLLMGSVALTLFSISMLIFQLSCKKEVNAQTPTNGITQLNKIVFTRSFPTKYSEIWISNYDGSNPVKVNINFPNGLNASFMNVKISPDGNKLFFQAGQNISPVIYHIYSCNIDGSNLTKIIDGTNGGASLEAAY